MKRMLELGWIIPEILIWSGISLTILDRNFRKADYDTELLGFGRLHLAKVNWNASINVQMITTCLSQRYLSVVSAGVRIRWLYLPVEWWDILKKKKRKKKEKVSRIGHKLYLKLRLQFWRSDECRVLLYCYYSQNLSDPRWQCLSGSHLWVKNNCWETIRIRPEYLKPYD